MIKPSWGKIACSTSLLALAILVVVNVVLSMVNPLSSFNPEKLPAAHSWIFWATEDFFSQPSPPDVVLLGSSLLVNPICEQEANFLQRPLCFYCCVFLHQSTQLNSAAAEKIISGRAPNRSQPRWALELPSGLDVRSLTSAVS